MVSNSHKKLTINNKKIRISIQKERDFYTVGPLWLKQEKIWRFSSNGVQFSIKNKPLYFDSYEIINENKLFLINNKRKIQVEINFIEEISDNLIEIKIFPEKKSIKSLDIKLNIDFDKKNNLDYVALSGNLYKNVKKREAINLKINQIGSFSGVWTVCSNNSNISIITVSDTNLKLFEFVKNNEITNIIVKIGLIKRNSNQIFLFLGNKDYLEPIKLKFMHLEPINPLNYRGDYKEKASKALYALKNVFSYKRDNGLIPANFIHYPIRKKDKLKKSPFCSYGNCFSLGAIYGTSALYSWTKDTSVKDTLINFLNPVMDGAQIKEGPVKGAFYDTFSLKKKEWRTGRVQFDDGGFSDWMPYEDNEGESKNIGGLSFKENLDNIKRDFLLRKSEFLNYFIWVYKLAKMAIPYMKKKISIQVIYPPYTGQFAYFLLQTLMESKLNDSFLGNNIEQELNKVLELSADFLVKTQRKNNIWDHELYVSGEIFWNKETLACIFPATFLIWWGKETDNQKHIKCGIKALEKCNSLQDRNEYYGMYFETNLAINQADLVTAIACIKCYCKLYELIDDETYLARAQKAAWHIISTMWSNIYDKKGKNITGGLLVTTYKGMGFPVIGGSELCQAFEVFCELSKYDPQFLVFAKALLGYCLNYLIREGNRSLGIYEIMFGYTDNWSTSVSADFASYASGPFIRGVFLLNLLTNRSH